MCTKQNFKHTCTIQNKLFFCLFFSNQQYLHTPCRLSHVSPDFQQKREITSQVESYVHIFFLFRMGKHFRLYGNGNTKASKQVKTSFLHFFKNKQTKKKRTLHRHSLNKCKLSSHTQYWCLWHRFQSKIKGCDK